MLILRRIFVSTDKVIKGKGWDRVVANPKQRVESSFPWEMNFNFGRLTKFVFARFAGDSGH